MSITQYIIPAPTPVRRYTVYATVDDDATRARHGRLSRVLCVIGANNKGTIQSNSLHRHIAEADTQNDSPGQI